MIFLKTGEADACWSLIFSAMSWAEKSTCFLFLEPSGNMSAKGVLMRPEIRAVCEKWLSSFTTYKMCRLLKKSKKTESRVKGDPLPHLICEFPEAFAEPVTNIFNAVNQPSEWPDSWKTEYLTSSLRTTTRLTCRNAETSVAFSKILENRLLLKLREELLPDPAQYGGMPRCAH